MNPKTPRNISNVPSRVVTGEIFPLKVRAKALSMTTATNWLLNWAIAFSTPYLVNYGEGNANLQSKIFFIWFGCCFLCIAFVYFMIYETKGLTLEQIDELYDEVTVASKSTAWLPSTTFTAQRAKVAKVGSKEKTSGTNGDVHSEAEKVEQTNGNGVGAGNGASAEHHDKVDHPTV
jgi:SP family sugar:H+ symporter-like MFS transporter